MKKSIFFLLFVFALTNMNAQTSTELIGKWQLIKWTKNGVEKNINDYFKTDQVYQVFKEDSKFESLVGTETHHGKWKISKDNKELTITSTLIPVKFQIDYFDKQKRVVTYEQLGTFEYKKITE